MLHGSVGDLRLSESWSRKLLATHGSRVCKDTYGPLPCTCKLLAVMGSRMHDSSACQVCLQPGKRAEQPKDDSVCQMHHVMMDAGLRRAIW